MKFFNTLTREIEELRPINNRRVNFFVCGPTVYDYAHVGNAKTYTQFDFIVRYLRYRRYGVFYLQNITNIDDKIIKRAVERKISWDQLAKEFEEIYYEDMKALHNTSVSKFARATDYIPQIVKQVKTLIDKGYGYRSSDGIYYDISKFADYGKLAGRTEADQNAGVSRIDEGLDKRHKNDFCLWRFSRPGEPVWETELGKGRPGWHIEDTAITESFFGPQYDVHGAAVDLIFPHHEAEIAQMEAASGKSPLARFWMHAAFLNLNAGKMSKSKGNFITAREAVEKHGYRLLRYFFISAHYRTTLEYNESVLVQASGALGRLDEFTSKIDIDLDDDKAEVDALREKVISSLDNDFDTPKALVGIFDYIRTSRQKAGRNAYVFFQELNGVFDFLSFEVKVDKQKGAEIDKLRTARDFAAADLLRKKYIAEGYHVETTGSGTIVKK